MADGQMLRVIVYDRLDQYVRDIDPAQIVELKSTEEINGEHSLTIKTTQELEKTNRLVIRDGMGIWHEYVVTGIEGEHGGRKVGAVVHTYHAVWSLQYDLSATYIDTNVGLRPGKPSVPAPALTGLQAALSGTERWQVGTITVTNSGSASFYRRSGWEGIKTLTENWGGEVEATIDVGLTGVVGRYVDLLRHVGSEDATRRFDYGGDVSKIKRTTSDEVWPCRIVPLGKSTETEAGGYTRRPTIADANQGIVWLEDASAVPFVRIPNGSGGWEYPTSIIKNDVYSDPAQLKAWALEHISEYTRPQVTYEADVVQLVKAGMNPHGVALGDNVVVVDRAFGDEGLAIDARVIKIVQSLIDSTDVKLTIGNAKQSLSTALSGLSRDIVRMDEQQTMAAVYQATADYMDALLGRLNDEINATGGWWYMIPGIGTRTYDAEVSDPAVGAEATKVVEIRGGNIRIADSRTAAGEWDFDTLFQSGHILSKLVTAAELIAGHIGSADSGNYWDLDSGEFRMASTAQLGTQTVQQVVDGVASASSAASSAQSTADSASSAAASAQSTADAASSAASSAQSAVNALSTQEAIFDLLTNDGQVQGLFMSGGQLYVNVEYLRGNVLSGVIIRSESDSTMPTPSGVDVPTDKTEMDDSTLTFYTQVFAESGGRYLPTGEWREVGLMEGIGGGSTPDNDFLVVQADKHYEERFRQCNTEAMWYSHGSSANPSGMGENCYVRFANNKAMHFVNGRLVQIGTYRNGQFVGDDHSVGTQVWHDFT